MRNQESWVIRASIISYLVCALFVPAARSQSSSPLPEAPKPKASTSPLKPASNEPSQPQAAQNATVFNPDGSSVAGNRYTNPYLGFTFDFPKGWLVFDNSAAKKGMDENKKKIAAGHPDLEQEAKKPDTGAPLLVAGEATAYKNGNARRTLKILVSDVSGEEHPSPLDFLNYMQALSKQQKLPIEFLSTPEVLSVNGKKLGKAYLQMPWENNVWYAAAYVLEEKKYMIQIMFTSPDRDGLAELEPWVQTLQFTKPSSEH